jgi:hypothetical protein
VIGFGEGPGTPRCSRDGCDADASWAVNWRNPKIHSADRVKVWLACDEHAPFLREFLLARSFPVLVTPMGEPATRVPDLTESE